MSSIDRNRLPSSNKYLKKSFIYFYFCQLNPLLLKVGMKTGLQQWCTKHPIAG